MAESGEEAIEKLKQKDYALIFMDIGLPGMTGIETAVAIRRLKDVTKSNTPIVALTGHAYGKSRQLCLNAGMQSVCSKPATPEDLRKALDYFSAS
jgi:CheY-like chemotaxis protein